jgi:hypothetical protein
MSKCFYIGDLHQYEHAGSEETNYTYVSYNLVFWIDDQTRRLYYIDNNDQEVLKIHYYLIE